MTKLPDQFISCDWGTTNFRLRLVETHSLEVLAEHQTDQGIRVMNEAFLEQPQTDRLLFYTNYLKRQMTELPLSSSRYQVVISGMASSNLGLKELPYADIPFVQNGVGLKWDNIVSQNGLNLLLISGVKAENGMMRGEEVQAIGLASHLEAFDRGILILPGTHSKHLAFNEGKFTGLSTFMTGEIFEVMSRHSILVNSISHSSWDLKFEPAFIRGFNMGANDGLTSSLFTVRANQVLRNTSKNDNYYTLSGMVMGDELSYLKGNETTIVLAAPEPLFSLYQTALKQIVPSQSLAILNEDDLAQALLVGQKKIMELNEN